MVESRGMQISEEARFWCFFTVVFSVLVFSRTTAGKFLVLIWLPRKLS